MGARKQIIFLSILAYLIAGFFCKPAKNDEDHPYEFGFTIDGQQHRHEKKDERGIIQGEFGFITADGIYHVTVYATDENGNFKILSMKNVRISAPLDGSPGPGPAPDAKNVQNKEKPQPLPLGVPETTKAPIQAISTTVKTQFEFTTQPTIKPACASCGYVTTPKPGQTLQQNSQQGYNQQQNGQQAYNRQGNGQQTYNQQENGQQNGQQGFNQQQNNQQAYNQQQNGQQTYNKQGNGQQTYNQQENGQQNGQQGFNQQQNNQQAYNQQENGQQTYKQENGQQNGQQTYNQQQNDQQAYNKQQNDQQAYNQQQNDQQTYNQQPNALTIPEKTTNNQNYNQENPLNPQPNALAIPENQPPSTLPPISVDNNQIQVGGDNPQTIPIKDKFPGMTQGLPDGVSEKDIKDLLYKFSYEVGFHGHWEKGLKNGAKIGGYFVNGRDGVSRVVTYIADENGYRPKFKFVRLGLESDETPKEGSEKTFGLKSFEFVWYPIE